MSKEMIFYIYLVEKYAEYKNKSATEVINEWKKHNLTNFIYEMYERYHSESIINAFEDIDELLCKIKTITNGKIK